METRWIENSWFEIIFIYFFFFIIIREAGQRIFFFKFEFVVSAGMINQFVFGIDACSRLLTILR